MLSDRRRARGAGPAGDQQPFSELVISINVKVEITITEATRAIVADFFPPMEAPLNVDVTSNVLTNSRGENTGKIRLMLNLEYDLPGAAGGAEKKTASGEWERVTTKSSIRETLFRLPLFFLFPPRRGLRPGHDAGDVGVFGAILPRCLGTLELGVRPPFFLFLALLLPGALFRSLLECWSGAVRHGSLLMGHL